MCSCWAVICGVYTMSYDHLRHEFAIFFLSSIFCLDSEKAICTHVKRPIGRGLFVCMKSADLRVRHLPADLQLYKDWKKGKITKRGRRHHGTLGIDWAITITYSFTQSRSQGPFPKGCTYTKKKKKKKKKIIIAAATKRITSIVFFFHSRFKRSFFRYFSRGAPRG